MIQHFTDHAANERTFLAWVRTGLAVIAFGFVLEKFNLLIATLAENVTVESGNRLLLRRLSGPLGHYDSLALILVGIGLIVIAGIRFVRTARRIDDPEPHSIGGLYGEVMVSTVLALLAAVFCVYVVLA
jgi:putative membrane protein